MKLVPETNCCRASELPSDRAFSSQRVVWLLAALLILLTPGCGGCRSDNAADKNGGKTEQEEEQEEEEQEKQDVEFGQLLVQPTVQASGPSPVKPGHWATASQLMRANHEDFVGELQLSVLRGNGQEAELDYMPYRLDSQRPVALAKDRAKRIDTTFFPPRQLGKNFRVRSTLRRRGSGSDFAEKQVGCLSMPSYQYFFLVLAEDPAEYGYIDSLPSVHRPFDNQFDTGQDRHYRVAAPKIPPEGAVDLPTTALAWTSTAYVLWDGVSPNRLEEPVQQALVDWIHWGGQLIISGPDSLDLLRTSFLGPFLPATEGSARTYDQENLQPLADAWTVIRQGSGQVDPASLGQTPFSGVEWQLHPSARVVPRTADLIAERRVGLGRVVISAIHLSEPSLAQWSDGFDNFFNNVLLRRPRRRWTTGVTAFPTLQWADGGLSNRQRDPRLMSKLRFFARDTGRTSRIPVAPRRTTGPNRAGSAGTMSNSSALYDPGVAAWNDFSDVAGAARESLRLAAGIKVPKASFVIGVLTVYLFLLVPLNWFVFYAIGRVELAWVAAPLIAVLGTAGVIWQAQLDIGFVRAQTEVEVIEMQAGYPRAHLSRYTAVYTSLGTTYDFTFEDTTAIAMPFPLDLDVNQVESRVSQVDFRKHDDVRLNDLRVRSSSTNMIHSEQMLECEGTIGLGQTPLGSRRVENSTPWNLQGAAVLHRPADGSAIEGAWLGELEAGNSALLSLKPLSAAADGQSPFAKERLAGKKDSFDEMLDLTPLFNVAERMTDLQPGEMRLVARTESPLDGLTVEPEASQQRSAALVVAHLQYGPLPDPRSDINAKPKTSGAMSGFLEPEPPE